MTKGIQMNKELLIKMGWSQDLIDSVLKMKKTLDESARYSSGSVVHIQSSIMTVASSIDTTHMVPIAENKIRL